LDVDVDDCDRIATKVVAHNPRRRLRANPWKGKQPGSQGKGFSGRLGDPSQRQCLSETVAALGCEPISDFPTSDL
jgi:hypothetical protein